LNTLTSPAIVTVTSAPAGAPIFQGIAIQGLAVQ
jgi:hypothetical protein